MEYTKLGKSELNVSRICMGCAGKRLEECHSFNVFVYADMESKIQCCNQKAYDGENLSDKEIQKMIKKMDARRKGYHQLVSSYEWKDMENYHLCVNTSGKEIKEIIPSLSSYIYEYMK